MDVNLYIDGDNSFGLDAGLVNVATDATLSIPGVAADAAATGEALNNLLVTGFSPLNREMFQANKKGLQVNTGTNTRSIDVIRNYFFSQGANRSGTTYRGVNLNSANPEVISNFTASGTVLYKRYFHAINASGANLYLKVDVFRHQVGSLVNSPQFYICSYDGDGKIYMKTLTFADEGYVSGIYLLDPRIKTWGNIGIWILFRNASVTLEGLLNLISTNQTFSDANTTTLATLTDSDKTVQENPVQALQMPGSLNTLDLHEGEQED